MQNDAANLLAQLLAKAILQSQDSALKLAALEGTVLKTHPELRTEYEGILARMNSDRAIQTNRESIESALERLRTLLAQ
jgi:hypothetical protein